MLIVRFGRVASLGRVGVALLIGLTSVAGCSQGQQGDTGDVDDRIVFVTGKVSTRGNSPFSLVMLEASDGNIYVIQSSVLGDELRNLTDMDVSVTGQIVPGDYEGDTFLYIISYDLRALPSGEIPIMGVIRPGGVIEDDNMVIWMLQGDFADVLRTFVGAKVWVVGMKDRWVNTPHSLYRALYVTEYGVIRP